MKSVQTECMFTTLPIISTNSSKYEGRLVLNFEVLQFDYILKDFKELYTGLAKLK